MPDESAISLPGLDPPAPAPAYRVLARKYRPASFDTLLGQQAMVQTLANAIARGRLAQAWLLTGVRGVGKTSTARIIAKALNCIGPDGQGGPTISPCGVCEPCTGIAAGRHMDVVEMDAASNTGVDDVREIIEGVRYAAVSARYKIHIIDEVHMLSKQAFNALLKTLEEPPPGVKFIMATTEVNKVPATILSRCQRFDLKRIPAQMLSDHFAAILAAEGVAFEDDAVAVVARAAEGSVRDGLSILDQAIAHSADHVTADAVRDMLGLADRGAVRALFGQALAGEVPAMLAAVGRQYDLGQDPAQLIRELLELVHGITRQRMAPRRDPALSVEEQAALDFWAQALPFPRLSMLWQLLLKGLEEVQMAPAPLQAAEMALLRLCHAAELPDPGALIRQLQDAPPVQPPIAGERPPMPQIAGPMASERPPMPTLPAPIHAKPPASGTVPESFEAMVAMFRREGESRLAHFLTDDIRPVQWHPTPALNARGVPRDVLLEIDQRLAEWTGKSLRITWVTEGGDQTLREIEQAALIELEAAMRVDPTVAALLAAFPDAELSPLKASA